MNAAAASKEQVRQELAGLKLKELYKKAEELGLPEAEGGGGGVKCYQELNTLLLCQFHHGICGVAAFFCVFSSDPSSPKSLRRDDFFRRPQEPNLSA